MPTTGYQAGIESNSVVLSYAAETVYGVLPAVQFQAIRMTGETLAGTKDRKPPPELQSSGETPQNVTLQESAGGAINFVLSYGTFDDFIAACLGNPWGTTAAIASIAGDITLTTGTNVLSSTLATKFTNIVAGQWIMLAGFVNGVNNGVFRVLTKTDNSHLILSGAYVAGVLTAFVTETPAGTAALVKGATIQNGTIETTLFIQKMFGPAIFLRYPGAFVQSFSISGATDAFITGSITLLPTSETPATTSASTGAILAAPARPAMAGVAAFGGVFWNEVPLGAVLDSFTLNVTNDGSALEFGMGSTAAQGFLAGLMKVSGTLKLYFRDLNLYNNFKAETQGRLSIKCGDSLGNVYVFTVLNAALMNPNVEAGSVNTPVWATFNIEGNPQTGGGTIQIDRLTVV